MYILDIHPITQFNSAIVSTNRKITSNSSRLSTLWDSFIKIAKNNAKIIDSRESTYRTALDIVAFDLPTMLAGAFRNFWNFLEATLEAGIGTLMVIGAPQITTFIGNLMGEIFLNKD